MLQYAVSAASSVFYLLRTCNSRANPSNQLLLAEKQLINKNYLLLNNMTGWELDKGMDSLESFP
jgi:hypothetical protein